MSNANTNFDLVEDYVYNTRAIAWDGCHKIYLLMDDEQLVLMREYGYEYIITSDEQGTSEMLTTLKDWYDRSCSLRFIQAVEYSYPDPNDGFTTLIGQFDDLEDEDEYEEEYA